MLSQLSYIPTYGARVAQGSILPVAAAFVKSRFRECDKLHTLGTFRTARPRHRYAGMQPRGRYASTFSSSRPPDTPAAISSASGTNASNRGSPFCESSTMPVRTSTYW